MVVRRAGRYSSEDLHRVLFAKPPSSRTLAELKEGLREHARGQHARNREVPSDQNPT